MNKIKKILCPTDLSPEGDEGLRYATALARVYGAELLLCYCRTEVQAHAAVAGVGASTRRVFEESFAHNAGFDDPVDLKWEGLVVEDEHPGEAIARVAAEQGADLIVMRSRRRPHRAVLLGSTAETVSRIAPCPVFVTHPDERDWVEGHDDQIKIARILVAYDFSSDAELALQYAIATATEYGAELHLLHVLPKRASTALDGGWDMRDADGPYHAARRRLREAVPLEAASRLAVNFVVVWGEPYAEILGYARDNEIDLICMGAQGADFRTWSLFGSNVDRVLRQAPCPAYVARPLRPSVPFA